MPRSAAIIIQNDRVALIRRERHNTVYYVFPGGRAETGEKLIDAAIREVREEVGLIISIDRLVAKVSFRGDTQYYYLAKILGGQFGEGNGPEMHGSQSADEGSYQPVWMSIEQLPSEPVIPKGLVEVIVWAMQTEWPDESLELQDP